MAPLVDIGGLQISAGQLHAVEDIVAADTDKDSVPR